MQDMRIIDKSKKNEQGEYTFNTPGKGMAEERVIEIGFWKALSIAAGALVVSIITTAFAIANILNSDHFTLATAVDDISELKSTTVRKDVLGETLSSINADLTEIKQDIKEIKNEKINNK